MNAVPNSPQATLDRLVEIFPDFATYWRDPENVFRNDDGSFTYCGAFSEFSHYFRDRYEELHPDFVATLGVFISECVASSSNELADAAATCFLENVSGERFSREFECHLTGSALQFYQAWNDA